MPTPDSKAIAYAALISLLCIDTATVHAQRNVDIERFRPAHDKEGFLGIQTSATPAHLEWNLTLAGSYVDSPLVVELGDEERDVIGSRVAADFIFQIGLGERVAAAVAVPFFYQDAFATPLGDAEGDLPSTALADPRVSLKYRLLGEPAIPERTRNEGPGLALMATGFIPVGADDAFAGEGAFRSHLALIGDFHVLGAGIGASIGWLHRFRTRELLGVPFRDELDMGAALKVPIPLVPEFAGILEVRAVLDAGDPFGDESSTPVEGDLGFRLTHSDWTITSIVGTGFNGGVGAPAVRAMLSVSWAPRVADADRDGISDSEDDCPHLPEDFDGFEDDDGCLDPDNDNDLIPDIDDRCPMEQAEEDRDEDEDGCTDPVADRDHDGVEDSIDACADQPEDRDGHQDDDGCPDPDNDQDGVPDHSDRCPNEPEDKDGFEDDDGCPDPDNDGDGLADAADRCPLEAEDKDGFEDEDGCPDPDNDRDGVVDAEDKCPDGAERINGVTDDDGCPDRGGRVLVRVRKVGDEEKLVTNVRFVGSEIAPSSTPAVAQLGRHIIARWPLVARVVLPSGEPKRLEALRVALVAGGAPEARLTLSMDEKLRGSRLEVAFESPADGAPGSTPPSEAKSGGADSPAIPRDAPSAHEPTKAPE